MTQVFLQANNQLYPNQANLSSAQHRRKNSFSRKSESGEIEASAATIIRNMEKDLTDIISEIISKPQKNKLISLSDTLKLLNKKLAKASSNSQAKVNSHSQSEEEEFNIYTEELREIKEDYATMKKRYDLDMAKAKMERDKLVDSLKFYTDREENYHTKDDKIKELERLLSQQTKDNNSLTDQVKLQFQAFEDTIKALNQELHTYKERIRKFDHQADGSHKLISDLKKSNVELKSKYEELKQINIHLKEKYELIETNNLLYNEEIKNSGKKYTNFRSKIEELEKENNKLKAELEFKSNRLNALRTMNERLESRSQEIVKKCEDIRLFEQKSMENNKENLKILEIFESTNHKLTDCIAENDNLRKLIKNLNSLNFQYKKENDDLKALIQELNIDKNRISSNSYATTTPRMRVNNKEDAHSRRDLSLNSIFLKGGDKSGNSFNKKVNNGTTNPPPTAPHPSVKTKLEEMV